MKEINPSGGPFTKESVDLLQDAYTDVLRYLGYHLASVNYDAYLGTPMVVALAGCLSSSTSVQSGLIYYQSGDTVGNVYIFDAYTSNPAGKYFAFANSSTHNVTLSTGFNVDLHQDQHLYLKTTLDANCIQYPTGILFNALKYPIPLAYDYEWHFVTGDTSPLFSNVPHTGYTGTKPERKYLNGVKYMRDMDDIIYVQGTIQTTADTIANYQGAGDYRLSAFTLPVAYRPATDVYANVTICYNDTTFNNIYATSEQSYEPCTMLGWMRITPSGWVYVDYFQEIPSLPYPIVKISFNTSYGANI